MKHRSNKATRRSSEARSADLQRVRGGTYYRTNVLGELGEQLDANEAGAPTLGSSGNTFGSVDFDDQSDYIGNGNIYPS